MKFPTFWIQSDIDWSRKLDNSSLFDIHSKMEWLLCCMVLEIGFHSKPTRWILPLYYYVPQVLDSIRYQLVHEIGQFRFVRSSLWNGVVGLLHSFSQWISLKTQQATPPAIVWCSPNFRLNSISIDPRNWTIDVCTKFVLKWSGWCIP